MEFEQTSQPPVGAIAAPEAPAIEPLGTPLPVDPAPTPTPLYTPRRQWRRDRMTGRARRLRQLMRSSDGFEHIARRVLGQRPARRMLTIALALTVLTRLPLFTIGLGIDEGGYSAVATQWNPLHPGTSTYGNLFLDRPPLLLLLVKASQVFGQADMRVVGMVCALATVSGVWLAARRLLGPTGAIIAAPLAAVYASIALTGVIFTNAELVAAPFGVWSVAVAAGVLPTMWKGRTISPRAKSPTRSLLLAGVLAGCASMCKQNFVDAGIAIFAALVVAVVVGRRAARDPKLAEVRAVAAAADADAYVEFARTSIGLRHIAVFVAGVLAVLAAALTWAVMAGPGLDGIWEALVVFRADVASVIANGSAAASQRRAWQLASLAASLGIVPVLLVAMALQVRDFRRTPVLSTLIITWTCVATAGVVLGGSYWVHYLQQIAFPAAIAAGFIAYRSRRKLPLMQAIVLLTLALVVTLIAVNASAAAMLRAKPFHADDAEIGDWVHDHARARDTIWVEYARANLVQASKLPTPYPYMWSLMVRGRPNATNQLRALLDSPRRPNWVVRWNVDNAWKLDPYLSTRATLARNYTKVGTVCGVEIMHDTATLATAKVDRNKPLYHGCVHHEWSDVMFGVVD